MMKQINSKVEVQPLTKDTIGIAQQLAREIWDEHYIKILSQEQIDYMLNVFYATSKIESELEEGILWYILQYENRPVGYLTCKLEETKVYISKLYLKLETRGMGLGKLLINWSKEIALKNHKSALYLNVNKYNSDSIKFYESQGFEKVDEGVFEIGNGFVMDDYIMEFSMR